MKHSLVTLPEYRTEYPYLVLSDCGTFRVIRCQDDIQFVAQSYESPKWRAKSYHVEYSSLLKRWSKTIPELPDALD
jgi:hypothetical protein